MKSKYGSVNKKESHSFPIPLSFRHVSETSTKGSSNDSGVQRRDRISGAADHGVNQTYQVLVTAGSLRFLHNLLLLRVGRA